ncbi:MAG TPA: alpha/beta hydrolase-fold protein [Vicinamibacterales bacterium]|nr:alpha/beta hydrolase-fold protein [Vicinamibacterales bacterium]
MRRQFIISFALVALCATTLVAQGGAGQGTAQPPAGGGRGGQQGPQVVSPEVHPDRSVTLRVLAPKATEILVTGEILNGGKPQPMTKGEDGIWTAKLGPVPPDVYLYAFNIDGVNTPDPRNPWVKLVSGAGLASQVEVPGDGLQYYDSKPVPHGLVQIMTYESKSAGATRQAWVYTPPDYGRTNTRYPVLYLLHGGGDMDPGWAMTGRAHIIMDNLIAEKKAVPMVVVMPLARGGGSMGLGPAGMSPGIQAAGNVAPGAGRGGGRGGAPAPAGPAPLGAFAQDFINDLLPAVEKTFRVSARPEDRAIGGLSMGGGATVNTAFSRPDLFRYVIIMSAGGGANLEEAYPKFFANSGAAAKQMKLIWLGVGEGDFALDGTKAIAAALAKHDIPHTLRITEGRHEWRLWRPHLHEFAQLLFRAGKGTGTQ